MAKRKKGYHYAYRTDGTKYRVYNSKSAKPRKSTSRRGSRGGKRKRSTSSMGAMTTKSKGHFRFRRMEYIGDIHSSQSFINFAFDINPGIPTCFPWLSTQAGGYEEYRVNHIKFIFRTLSTDSVVTTNSSGSLGAVVMATEYNPYAGPMGNKQQMENYEGAKSCKPSRSMVHHVSVARRNNPLKTFYIRTGKVPEGQDIRFYDVGLFQIATVGMQSNGGLCGELWVDYDIEFLKPRMPSGGILPQVLFDHIAGVTASVPSNTTTVTPARPFGTSTTQPWYGSSASTLGGMASGGIIPAATFVYRPASVASENFIGGIPVLTADGLPDGTLGPSAPNTYYFPPGITEGNFSITYFAEYTTPGTASWNPVTVLVNCSDLDIIDANSTNEFANTGGTNFAIHTAFIKIDRANASFSVTGTTGAYATCTSLDIYVTQLPTVVN